MAVIYDAEELSREVIFKQALRIEALEQEVKALVAKIRDLSGDET